jgi:raffinose/stachyose/melibiose transport system substrate-binding protein
MGTWDLTEGRANAADKQGLSNEKLGFIFFPAVKGGKGKATDLFANLNGWLLAKEAPKETVDFAKVRRQAIRTRYAAQRVKTRSGGERGL